MKTKFKLVYIDTITGKERDLPHRGDDKLVIVEGSENGIIYPQDMARAIEQSSWVWQKGDGIVVRAIDE